MTPKFILSMIVAASQMTTSAATSEPARAHGQQKVTIVYTTDVHGNFFPYDFIRLADAPGSMARVATAVKEIRATEGKDYVLLLDNGDILQGQPSAYYYNFIDTTSRHIVPQIYDFLGYDAATIGNHDVETGHAVYDRWISENSIPIMGANVIDAATGRPYLQPYSIFNRGGLRIAVLGLLTPAIPAWLPERLWSGLQFEPMEESARKWIDIIRRNENPDIIIGLFHSGRDSSKTTAGYVENASMLVARNVEGFDAVLMGHDHQTFCDTLTNTAGKTVYLLNPANNAMNIGRLSFVRQPDGQFLVEASIQDVSTLQPDADYLKQFDTQRTEIESFVTRQIATISDTISTRDAFFGPSAFMTLLHKLQLDISGADISMAAPLTFDGMISAGPLRVADMFTLYKYENMLCTLRLTGQEIKDYLEFSYDVWTNTVSSPTDHLIKFASKSPTPVDNRLKNPSYNFDSAAGINYTVDVTKPHGEKITITSLSDGRPFDMDSIYTVAVNSYRAGGGGDHLTRGAGITPEELKQRIVSSTDKDLRYYLMQTIEKTDELYPQIDTNWQFIPSDIAKPTAEIDRLLLFGPGSSKNQK